MTSTTYEFTISDKGKENKRYVYIYLIISVFSSYQLFPHLAKTSLIQINAIDQDKNPMNFWLKFRKQVTIIE